MKIFMCDNEFSKVIDSVEAHMESFSIDRNKLYTFKRGNQKGISFRDFSDSSCAVFIVNSQWYAYSYGLMRDVPITAKKAIESINILMKIIYKISNLSFSKLKDKLERESILII